MIEQVRLWFYSMLVFGVVFEDSRPYENVLGFAEVRDENNQRMSKTAHNYIPLDEASDKVGTDLIRWNFLTASVGANIRFGFSILDDVRRRFYIPLWNTYNYFVTYAKLHDWNHASYDPDKVEHVMDKWIVSKVRKLAMDVEENMEQFNMAMSSRDIEDFIKDLSQWYIRRSRDRFRDGDSDAIGTLHYVLLVLTKLLAPFVPFISDEIYSNIAVNLGLEKSKNSVHLEDYPEFKKEDVDEGLLEKMVLVRDICSNGLKAREMAKLNLRQPLNKAYIGMEEEFVIDIVKNELNLKEVKYSKEPVKGDGVTTVGDNDLYVSLDTNLTEELKEEGIINDFLRKYRDFRKREGFKIEDVINIEISVGGEGKEVIEGFVKESKEEMQVGNIVVVDSMSDFDREFKIGEIEVRIRKSD
jgi:isoleucyl-tRNA synthetase